MLHRMLHGYTGAGAGRSAVLHTGWSMALSIVLNMKDAGSALWASDRKQEAIPAIAKGCKCKAEAEAASFPRILVRDAKWC